MCFDRIIIGRTNKNLKSIFQEQIVKTCECINDRIYNYIELKRELTNY